MNLQSDIMNHLGYEPKSDINKFESYLLGYEPSQSDINKFESYLLGYEPSQSDIWTITKVTLTNLKVTF